MPIDPEGPTQDQPGPDEPSPADAKTEAAIARDAAPASPSRIGRRVGQYTVTGVLGEGGMGVVYRATQERPQREVALKLVRPGNASRQHLRRFEFEAEMLGRLAHPGIAQIYEAGIEPDSGSPYFAMELVEGEPLTAYAARKGLGTRERMRLLTEICRAVQHAHAKGVIHRDLKPSNILVAEVGDPPKAQPKILDFGVARLTDSDTQTTTLRTDIGQLIGTVPYMSPEQVGGNPDELDTRSDVYALGVVLYELLVGRLPYDLADRMIHEAVRVIREEEPTRLSSIDRSLRGDVETIVAKALEKERERRYQSVGDLATDIDRYLNDEPIAARPASTWYQLRKFARRHTALVGGVAATFFVLVAGILGTTTFALSAEERRVQAERAGEAETAAKLDAQRAQGEATARAEELAQVAEFQAGQLEALDPIIIGLSIRAGLADKLDALARRRGLDETAMAAQRSQFDQLVSGADFTGLALETLDENIFSPSLKATHEQFASQPLVKARLLDTLACIMYDTGLIEPALAPQAEARIIRRDLLGDDHPDAIASTQNLGNLYRALGNAAEAEPLLRDAVERSRRVLGEGDPRTLNHINNLATLLRTQGRLEEAEALFRTALEGLRAALGDDDPETLEQVNNLGAVLGSRGRLPEAEALYKEAYEGFRRVLGEDHPSTIFAMGNVGLTLDDQGRAAEAEPYYRAALDGFSRILGDSHPNTLTALNNLAVFLASQGRLAEAEPYFMEALAGRRRVLGPDHPASLGATANVGLLLMSQGKLQEAEPYYVEALEGFRAAFGPHHPAALSSTVNMGGLLEQMGRPDEAEALYREASAGYRQSLGNDHPETLTAVHSIGRILAERHEWTEAVPYLREALDGRRRALGDDHPDTILSMHDLAGALVGAGAFAEAEPLATECESRSRAAHGEHSEEHERALRLLVNLHDAWQVAEPDAGHGAEAERWRTQLATPAQREPEVTPPGDG